MARWYVSVNDGDDLNGGQAPDDAFATISHAVTTASAGDVIAIAPGTYSLFGDNAGDVIALSKPYLTFEGLGSVGSVDEAFGTTLPVLTTTKDTAASPVDWVFDAAVGVWYFEQASGHNPHGVFDPSFSGLQTNSGEVDDLADITAGTMFFEAGSPDRIYYVVSTGSPAANPGEVGVGVPLQGDFFEPSATEGAARGITFRNLRFDRWSDQAIRTGQHLGWRVINCVATNGIGPVVRLQANDTVVRDNVVVYVGERQEAGEAIEASANIGTVGVFNIEGARGCLVYRNVVERFTLAGVVMDGLVTESPVRDSGGNVALANIFRHGRPVYSGTTLDVTRGVLAARERSDDAEDHDILAFNVIDRCGQAAMTIENATKAAFFNNTVYDVGAGIVLDGGSLACVFQNNIISEVGRSWATPYVNVDGAGGAWLNDAAVVVDDPTADELDDLRTHVLARNIYHREARGVQPDPVLQFRWLGRLTGLDGWQDLTNYDRASKEASPGFNDATSGDLTISFAAEAVGYGRDTGVLVANLIPRLARLIPGFQDTGAFPLPKGFDADPEDLRFFLTGNDRTDVDTWGPNTSGSVSLGGTKSDSYAHQQSIMVDLAALFDHVGGPDLEVGVTQYRAIDIKNIAIRGIASSSGAGTRKTNFGSETGKLAALKVWISKVPQDLREVPYEGVSPAEPPGTDTTTIALAWENIDASPEVGQGPLANDTTAPTGLTFESPTEVAEAIICPDTTLLPQRTLDGSTTLEGEVGRLWIRRTVAPEARYQKIDLVEFTFSWQTSGSILGEDQTPFFYLAVEES